MWVGLAFVSMVVTNFYDSKLIKGDSAPVPNDIGAQAQLRSGPEVSPEVSRLGWGNSILTAYCDWPRSAWIMRGKLFAEETLLKSVIFSDS